MTVSSEKTELPSHPGLQEPKRKAFHLLQNFWSIVTFTREEHKIDFCLTQTYI